MDAAARPRIAETVLDLVGGTPLVKVGRLCAAHGVRATVAIKLESLNPGGSAKDRIAIAMIDAAERDGLIRPGGTIVEPTSGNTGVGLAIVAAQRGYKCVFVCTDKVSPIKVDLLRAYGAEVVVCPVSVPPEDPSSYYSTAERLAREIPGAYRPNQYANPANPLAHERTTGPEIWEQTAGAVTHFVAGMGTGGTITGTTRYLKSRNPAIVAVGADSESSVYTGGSGRPYLVEGIGEDFFPETMDLSIVDHAYAVSDEDSFLMARELARPRASLSAAPAAARWRRRSATHATRPRPRAPHGRARPRLRPGLPQPGVQRRVDVRVRVPPPRGHDGRDDPVAPPIRRPLLLYVNPEQPVSDAIDLMRTHEVSQIPVIKNEPPFANAEVAGAVDELQLMHLAVDDPSSLALPVGRVMGPKLPTVGIGERLQDAVARLEDANAVLVLKGGRPYSILSRADVLRHLRG